MDATDARLDPSQLDTMHGDTELEATDHCHAHETHDWIDVSLARHEASRETGSSALTRSSCPNRTHEALLEKSGRLRSKE